eukprot:TRINITY_DN24879_c0_g1_i4.p1 TRINITY_DN24879_c0_g1~~TRINITY_DN24879_c0_g1_i4.p1  ORF type:complete len:268 (-),score=63.62 TRINITY_DN24879_c0_g1_i4:14-817(-)
MENIPNLIGKLEAESSPKVKALTLKQLKQALNYSSSLNAETVGRLLNILKLLVEKHSDLALSAINLIAFTATHSKSITNIRMGGVYSSLILALGSVNLQIVTASKECLHRCITERIDVGGFLSALQNKGVASENYSVRSNSLELVASAAKMRVLDASKYETQVTKILEELLKYVETHELFVIVVKANPPLHKVCSNLPAKLKERYEELFKMRKEKDSKENNEFTLVEPIKMPREELKFGFLPEYLSLIHICRCRRYAVCRSRWSPYH